MVCLSVVYLHGFASSPRSVKTAHFRAHFARRGDAFMAPDLNAPEFSKLTLARIIHQAHEAAAQLPQDRQLVVIGSSLGGLAATLFAAERAVLQQPVAAAFLLAPAFELASLWRHRLGMARIDAWQRGGSLSLQDADGNFVYGPAFSTLEYGFYADAIRRETQIAQQKTHAPTLVFHGEDDQEVPVEFSRRYAAGHAHVDLITYPHADHTLQDLLGDISANIDASLSAVS